MLEMAMRLQGIIGAESTPQRTAGTWSLTRMTTVEGRLKRHTNRDRNIVNLPTCESQIIKKAEHATWGLICVQRWCRKGMLCKVSALALFVLLSRFAGGKTSFVSCRLLKSFLVARLKATGKIQASKLAEKRHHVENVTDEQGVAVSNLSAGGLR